jgi:hypothetical protein
MWLIDWVWIRWLDLLTLYTLSSSLQVITALSLIYTLYTSLEHTKSSQSSLVISWHWMCNSLTVSAAHYEIFFAQHNSFLAFILPTANSGISSSSNSLLQLPTISLPSFLSYLHRAQLLTDSLNSLSLSCQRSYYIALGWPLLKTLLPLLLCIDSLLQRSVYHTIA